MISSRYILHFYPQSLQRPQTISHHSPSIPTYKPYFTIPPIPSYLTHLHGLQSHAQLHPHCFAQSPQLHEHLHLRSHPQSQSHWQSAHSLQHSQSQSQSGPCDAVGGGTVECGDFVGVLTGGGVTDGICFGATV